MNLYTIFRDLNNIDYHPGYGFIGKARNTESDVIAPHLLTTDHLCEQVQQSFKN